MSGLSPKELALLDAARPEWHPRGEVVPPSAEEIALRLAAKPWLAEGPPIVGHARIGRAVGHTLVACGLATMAVVVVHLAMKPASSPAKPNVAELAVVALPAPSPPRNDLTPSIAVDALPDAPQAAVVRTRKNVVPAPAASEAESSIDDTLAEEIRLVSAAQSALRDNAPERALAALSEHASRFPHGVLRDERMASRVLALCALGDEAQARIVKSELERSSPYSSHLQRLAGSCAR